jgi:hypothetical protein
MKKIAIKGDKMKNNTKYEIRELTLGMRHSRNEFGRILKDLKHMIARLRKAKDTFDDPDFIEKALEALHLSLVNAESSEPNVFRAFEDQIFFELDKEEKDDGTS